MKQDVSDLAYFGGSPAFVQPLYVGTPNIGDRAKFLERAGDILDRRRLTNMGPFEQEFERRVADIAGTKHAIATCNGTLALEIAIRAMGLKGEVIVPSFTFVATAHALQWQEITPVFCDIDPQTYNIDPHQIERHITPKTSAIIGVHLWGRSCDTARLEAIASKHGLVLLFDSSHAFGCTRHGRPIGSFGDAEIFSFHATKFINALEGGAIVTDNDELAQKARLMKNFGFVHYDKVIHVGSNGKMNEMSAAMGLTSLESMEEFIAINRRNYLCYRQNLAGLPGVSLVAYDKRERNNYQYVVARIDRAAAGISRDELVNVLHADNVIARRYFHPGCHRMEPYCSYFPNAGLLLPETERASEQMLSLPTGTAISEERIDEICAILRTAVTHADQFREEAATLANADSDSNARS